MIAIAMPTRGSPLSHAAAIILLLVAGSSAQPPTTASSAIPPIPLQQAGVWLYRDVDPGDNHQGFTITVEPSEVGRAVIEHSIYSAHPAGPELAAQHA